MRFAFFYFPLITNVVAPGVVPPAANERCIRAPEVAVDLQQMATGCCHMLHVGRQTLDLHAAAAFFMLL